MAVSVTFTSGTVIPSNWLNWVNTVVNTASGTGTVTSASVVSAMVLQAQLRMQQRPQRLRLLLLLLAYLKVTAQLFLLLLQERITPLLAARMCLLIRRMTRLVLVTLLDQRCCCYSKHRHWCSGSCYIPCLYNP
jgi:hypothetical protein